LAAIEENDRGYRGFNFFDPEDEELFRGFGSGEDNISGFQNKDLRRRQTGHHSGAQAEATPRHPSPIGPASPLKVLPLLFRIW